MKPYVLLTLLFSCFAWKAYPQQSINNFVISAQRGETITFTYTSFKDDVSYCTRWGRTLYLKIPGDSNRVNNLVDIGFGIKLNDSTTQYSVKIPPMLPDSQILSFVGYGRLGDGDCDTMINDTAIMVMGGSYLPGFYIYSNDTLKRGMGKVVTIDAKGFSVKGKIVEEIKIRDYWQEYIVSAPDMHFINDSQLVGTFTIPKAVPDGRYRVYISLKEAAGKRESYAFLNVYGGKSIPYLDFVSPNTIGRGAETEVRIHTKGTEFLVKKPYVSIGNEEIKNIVVENDTTVKCTLKISTGVADCFMSVTCGSSYDGSMFLDSAITVSGGKPLAKVKFEKEYVVRRGQKIKAVLKGENTHFVTGGFILEQGNYNINIVKTEVVDSVTMYIYLEVEEEMYGNYNFGYCFFSYSDEELLTAIDVKNPVVIMPDTTQGHVIKMEPPYFYYNTTQNYTFTMRNVKLSQLNDKYYWQIGAYSILNYQYPEVLDFSFLNDSMMRISIKFDEYFTDPVCAINFNYNLAGGYVTFETFVIAGIVHTGNKENNKPLTSYLKVYPNPTTDKLYLETDKQVNTLKIIDLTGKQTLIHQNDIERSNNRYTIPIDKYGLQKGFYLLQLQSETTIDYQKFMIE